MKNKMIATLIATAMILSMTGCGANPVAGLFDKDAKVCVTMLGGTYSSVTSLFGGAVIVKTDNDTFVIIDPATGEKLVEDSFDSVHKCSDPNARYVIGVRETDDGYSNTVYDEAFNVVFTYTSSEYSASDYVDGYLFVDSSYEEDGTTYYKAGILDTANPDEEPFCVSGTSNVYCQIYNGMLYAMSNTMLSTVVSLSEIDNYSDAREYLHIGDTDYAVLRSQIDGEGYAMADEFTPNEEGSLSYVTWGIYNVNDGSFTALPENAQKYKLWTDRNETVSTLGSYAMVTEQEVGDQEKDTCTYRLFDALTGAYVGDGEYMSLSAGMPDTYTDYTVATNSYYLVKYADETWGYLDSNFNDLGASYDDAAYIMTITDEEGDSRNISIVVEDGQASVVVDGVTPLEKYYTLNEKGKCVKSQTCPIGQINSSYYAGESADGSTCYYAVTTDDENYQLVAISLVD